MMAADLVVDNGDPGYAETSGNWENSSLGGAEGDSRYTANGEAVYQFSGDAGLKEILVSTPGHANSTNGAVYSIEVNGQAIGQTTIDQRPGTNGWVSLGVFDIQAQGFSVRVAQAGEGYLRADAVRAVDVESSPGITADNLQPSYAELAGDWHYSSLGGYNGSSRYSDSADATARFAFGDLDDGWYEVRVNTPAHANSSSAATYSISDGVGELGRLTLDQRAGSDWRSLGLFEVSGGALNVDVAQTGAGILRADSVRLVAQTAPTPAPSTIDNGDPFYAETGSWNASSLGGVEGDSRHSGDPTATANFSFTNVGPGNVEVEVQTPGHSNSTNKAVYTVTSAGQVLGTVELDQRPGTGGWLSLGTFAVSGSTLQVTVSQGGTGYLRADAMRATPVAPNTAPTSAAIPSVNVPEDAAPTVSLRDYFADAEDADEQLVFSIVGNSNAGLLSGTSIDPETGILSLTLTPDASGQGQLTIRATDSGGLYVEETLTVDVSAVDDPPDVVLPTAHTATEDADHTITGISIQNRDASDGQYSVTLSVNYGVLTLASTSGLIFSSGDGQQNQTMTFRGSAASVNSALASLLYRGASNFFGNDTLTLQAADDNFGYGGGLSESEQLAISVQGVNDPPTISNFGYTRQLGDLIFSGQVDDEDPEGLIIVFGGLLQGETATVDANGFFSLQVTMADTGVVTAMTTDAENVASNTAETNVENA